MSTTLNMTLLLRRAAFEDTCVLAVGEPGFHTTTKELKIGDGTKTWAELPFANQTQIEALIKVVDDKVAALGDTYATDEEVRVIKEALEASIKAINDELDTYGDIVTHNAADFDESGAAAAVASDLADYESANDERVKAIEDEIDTFGDIVAYNVADFATAAQGATADATAATVATYGDIVTHNVAEFATAAQGTKADNAAAAIATYGDIVTHNVAEFEVAGAASEAEGRINETLKSYYTKTEADAEFATPAEVITEVNKALADVSDADSITNITTLVTYVNENAADLTGLITEVYGSKEMTGDSRIDLVEGRLDALEADPAAGITADDIAGWNGELGAKELAQGVKDVVDANKATWDKAGTAVQTSDFDTFKNENTQAIANAVAPKLDTATYNAYIDGKSMSDAELKKYAEDEADAAETAAKSYTDTEISDFNTETVAPIAARVKAIEDAPYATTANVATAKQEAIDAAKDYADSLDHEDTTYTVAATENALEFTITPDGKGDAQTIKLVAPTVNTGIMEVAAGEDIVVTPGENGKVTIAHAEFTTGEYTKTPSASDKTGDVYMMTGVTVDNGHVTGANVQSLAHALMGMKFVFDGGTSAN